MQLVNTLFFPLRSRIKTIMQTLIKGRLGWMIIVLSVILFYCFYFSQVKVGMTMEQLSSIGAVSMVSILLSAWIKARRGALLAWLLVSPNLLINGHIAYGVTLISSNHYEDLITFLLITFGISLAAGQFSSLSHRLALAYAAIQKQALTDSLTGLPNHRAIIDQLEKEVSRAKRYGRPFSLLFFDADRFKRVNDTYGHSAGDAVLRQIGERAGSILRGGDTLGRFGGEEFILLLPEATASEARAIAERVRTAVAARPMTIAEMPEGLPMSVSIGVATFREDANEGTELLSLADEAMYLAKRLGRNQVRTVAESRQARADPAFLLVLQEAERREAMDRQGKNPEQLQKDYTLKIISSLLLLMEQRDPAMREHSQRVSDLAITIAQELALEPHEVFQIGNAALLHDIGKVGLPDALLGKAEPLSNQERLLLNEHPERGAQILQINPFLRSLIPGVKYHHERWDGTGYPEKKGGELIPLAARIIAVAESYDTLLHGLSSQESHSLEEVIGELQRGVGTKFDRMIVQSLLSVLNQQQPRPLLSIAV